MKLIHGILRSKYLLKKISLITPTKDDAEKKSAKFYLNNSTGFDKIFQNKTDGLLLSSV